MQHTEGEAVSVRPGLPAPMRTKNRGLTRRIPLMLAVLLLGLAVKATASTPLTFTPLTFSSGQQQVHLLELYTSEGCSSCPPADAWLATLREHPQLWERIVPVAFHVDYWNYLGWKDPLSSHDNSRRQRQYKREGAVNAVYTPGFVYSGQEWRDWFSSKELPQHNAVAGSLTVSIDNGRLAASYNTGATTQTLQLQVALLGFDLTTAVRGGENRGKDLTHQFAVLAHEAIVSKNNRWSLPLPKTDLTPERLGLAVWVTTPDSQQPLQATGGWLP
ncbi:MAG: hypothetical protein ACI9NT_002446 [Bacteroidia bacterium]|jgi:hypothetical protein